MAAFAMDNLPNTFPDIPSKAWYIVQNPAGQCQIVATDSPPAAEKHWGPFEAEAEAIARRVGLIRAGKCRPV